MSGKKSRSISKTVSRKTFSRFCQLLYERHLVAGVGGNVAARTGTRILLTPSGVSLRDVESHMLVTVDECGKDPAGGTPTKDMPMHLGILKQRPDMGVVCHIHNSYIIAASAMLPPGSDTLPPLTPGFVYYAYPLPMLPFLPPGSQELAEAAAEKLSRHNALLLQSHGLITLGRDFPHAVNMAEEIEEAARIFVLSRGTAKSISQDHIQGIRRK